MCSYFDLEAGPDARAAPPQMTFIKDVTIGEGESVPPDTRFVKTWKVQNTGGDRWPDGAYTSGRGDVPSALLVLPLLLLLLF